MHPEPPPSSPLRVALFGLGTVGRAVAASLVAPAWRAHIAERGVVPPELVAVGVREPEKPRDITLPESVRVTDALDELAVAGDVDIVVELIGGEDVAADVITDALAAGKGVVTANKALLAASGGRLEAAARNGTGRLRFEGAVAGGVPVLAPLVADLAASRIESVRGILNGTTNNILTEMSEGGRTFDDVLLEAQARGVAEADPSADVTGLDARRKLTILGRLAFGGWLPLETLRSALPPMGGEEHPGITGVQPTHLARAKDLGLTIKLVARIRDRGARLAGGVTPMAVRRDSPIGTTNGIGNIVEIDGTPVGRVSFRGAGAGGPATSSAVLADVLALARGRASTWGTLPPAGTLEVEDDLEVEHAWLVILDRPFMAGPLPDLGDLVIVGGDEAIVTRPVILVELAHRLAAIDGVSAVYPLLADA